jgi:hypothetical protein
MPVQLDLLITHAKVFTADPEQSAAEAVGVRDGRIVFVGSDEEARHSQGGATRSIDAQGATLLPGFIDSHFHLLWGAIEMSDAQLNQAQTVEEISADLRAFAHNNPDREWIIGRGIRYESLGSSQTLTRHQFDEIIADRPAVLYAFDTHTAWANSEAIRRGGLLGGAQVPDGSQIVMAADGTAHGELREPGAFGPIQALIPKPDDTRKRALLHQAMSDAASLGITSVHNMNGDLAEISLYAALEDLGEMTIRVYVPFHVKPDMEAGALEAAAAMREQHQTGLAPI